MLHSAGCLFSVIHTNGSPTVEYAFQICKMWRSTSDSGHPCKKDRLNVNENPYYSFVTLFQNLFTSLSPSR